MRLSQKSNFAGKPGRKIKLKIKTLRLTAFPAIIRFITFETTSNQTPVAVIKFLLS
jgi:hypothetical protein